MTPSPVLRSRTPPDLKWLLNERAAIAGEVNKATIRCQALAAKMETLQREQKNLRHKMQSVSNVKNELQVTLDALDTTIGLAYRNVRPDAAGVVNAWAGKYGHWGGMTEFIVQALKDASPAPVNLRHLITRVALHFQIVIVTPADRTSLKKSVNNTVARLAKRGLVYPMHSRVGNKPGLWCWKQPATLADLAVRAAAIAKAAADEAARANGGCPDSPHAHPS